MCNAHNQFFAAAFYLLPLENCYLVLGTPWLILSSHEINWPTLNVFHYPPVETGTFEISPTITSIPKEGKAFQKVFSEDFFTMLPANRSYGCAIPLAVGKENEHIDTELEAGKICLRAFCAAVDYRCLNAITIKDCYALPMQDELIKKRRHAKIFTKLDLRNSYNNIRIKEREEWKASFRTKCHNQEEITSQNALRNLRSH
ncbi:similar to pol polyprotein [Rhizoctonia solani AG-1 IB]|uniref:Similar to pol polyprotein n=1 Tax=Thanatephorus cucumeris (strain AG1-IB / isolate 7/3/14) TaxID=1108050 RepID=M5BQW1_THACB|nr:similar to pol polyprotein [Rhizoctonia solani AG-1 IB]